MIAGLICWYDEHPAFLVRAVYTATRIGIRHIVALDGAYGLFPGGRAHSDPEQARRIHWACNQLGLTVEFGKPKVWETEIEKRNTALRLAENALEPSDWFCWLDADFEVMTANPTLPAALAVAYELHGYEAAEVRMRTLKGNGYYRQFAPIQPFRWLYRLGRGLHLENNHYTYVTADGRRLWGSPTDTRYDRPVEPALDLFDQVEFVHHTNFRPEDRARRQIAYYTARDLAGIERGRCHRCGERNAVGMAVTNLRQVNDHQIEADWIEVCAVCEPDVVAETQKLSEWMGVEPGQLPAKAV